MNGYGIVPSFPCVSYVSYTSPLVYSAGAASCMRFTKRFLHGNVGSSHESAGTQLFVAPSVRMRWITWLHLIHRYRLKF